MTPVDLTSDLTSLLYQPQYCTGRTYLNTAAEGLILKAAAESAIRYLNDKATGEPGRVEFWKTYELTRERAARLFQTSVEKTALISSTTEGLNTIANAIDWKPGDEVVLTSVEFPSNLFPWIALQKMGVVTRIVTPRDGRIHLEDLLEQVTPRTRLVTLSQVSYATGQHIDPTPLWERLQNTNTLLCVDATQAAGRVPVDARNADFTIASCFKWLNSSHGSAILACSERVLSEQFAESVTGPAGWLSAKDCFASDRFEKFTPRVDAQKFQAGMPNFESVYALCAALDFHTPESVSTRDHALKPLVQKLVSGIAELDLNVLVPNSPADQAGIVPIQMPDAVEWKQKLGEQKIFVQGDDGRVRAAVHWYNTMDDIDTLLSAIARLLNRRDP